MGRNKICLVKVGTFLGFGFNYRTTVAVGVQKPHLQWVDLGS